MEIMDPGLWSMVGFGMAVVVGGLLMAAISFFSMKETSFEDVVAEQRRKKELEDKERSRLSKQKREFFKKKFEIKKKKGNTENGKPVIEQTTVHPVQSIPTTVAADEQKKPKKEKPTKKVKATTPVSDPPAKVAKLEQSSAPVKEKQPKPEPKAKKVEPVIKPTVADNVQSKPAVKSSKKSAEPAKETKVEEPRKPRQHKVSFSEDVKSVDSGNQEQKSKKKKGRKQQEEHPIIQAVSSADIDDSTIYYLVELLNQRLQSASGDWATAGNDVSKQQYAELQRKYESKSVEMQNAVSQSKMQSQKIQQLNQALQEAKLQQKSEVQKSDEELLKTRKAFDEYQARTKTQMEEDKKMITIMQEKLKSVNSSGDALQKMKEENDILKMTIQANASQVAEKDRLAHEVSACQAKLKENEQIRVEMERKIAEYSGTYQDQAQLEQSYTKRLEDMAAKLKATEGKYGALESEFQEAQTHLQSTQAKSSQLISQVVLLTEQNDQRSALESEYGSLAETKQALEDRLTAMEANEQSTADEFARLQSQNNQLNLKATSLTEQLNKATEEVNKYKQGRSDEVTNVTKQLKEKEGALSELQKRFDDLTEQSQKAASQVEKLDKKNNELRERNWKAMEAVAAAEKVAREKCSAAKDERDTAVLDTENQVKKSLSKSFPSVKVEGKDFECWLSNFLVKASESVVVTEVVDNEDKLQDLKQQLSEAKGKADKVDKYQSQVGALEKSLSAALQRNKETEEMINKQKQEIKGKSEEVLQFKEILKNTEGILDQLQSSVEKSEKDKQEQAAMWESKKQEEVSKLEKQLSKSNKELKEQTEMLVNMEKERDNLKECVAQRESELDTCLRKCGELETSLSSEKVNDTQELCESGTDSRDTSSPIPLSLKDADIDINKAELTEDDHGFLIIEHDESNASTSHEDQSRDSSVQENGHIDEIAKLKERLEKEKTLTKNLGAAAGKLQNVLKQTQEQLGKEREKNKELMQKKKEGSSSSSSSSSESDLD
uniref:ribosome-binding protein 1 isoform X2 n=1 Tax=Ciona intestinalis TaxID=7719 RepID=UPI0005216FF6|nr:ribosome-binding protein 1 isoform X2 [Ciona intestinalis]|eukprot:XP_009861117.1 ribosome-binding protein 1 isoform X2 [Ciona intestinalis]